MRGIPCVTKLIVGLGNPGNEYAKTRHNVGFWCLDEVAARLGSPNLRARWNGLVAEISVDGERAYLLYPQTYMNRSGDSVAQAVRYLGIGDFSRELVIVCDDLDLPPGTLRLRLKGSAGGHNGVKSILAHLGTEEFPRIRLGIGRPPFDITVVDYVLANFSKSERVLVGGAVDRAADAILKTFSEPFDRVMTAFNARA